MPKRRGDKAAQFRDLEAEEGSEESSSEDENRKRRREDREAAEPAEVRELREEIERNAKAAGGEVGAQRLFGGFMREMEERARQEEEEEKRKRELEVKQADADLFRDPLAAPINQDPDAVLRDETVPDHGRLLGAGNVAMQMQDLINEFPEDEVMLPPSLPVSEAGAFDDLERPSAFELHGKPDRVTPGPATEPVLMRQSDPKLWCVKIFGEGIDVCNTITTKMAYKQKEDPDFVSPVFSVLASRNIKNYIYIEAFKEQELRKFLQGIRGVSAWDTRLVPPDDSFNVLRQCMGQAGTTPHSHIKAGQFVRVLANGTYRGDLGRVLKIDEKGVQVRMKPRLPRDVNTWTGGLTNYGTNIDRPQKFGNKNTKIRAGKEPKPPAQFFTYDTANRKELGIIFVEELRDIEYMGIRCFQTNGDTFTRQSGHIFKHFPLAKIDPFVNATMAEKNDFSNVLMPEDYAAVDESVTAGLDAQGHVQLGAEDLMVKEKNPFETGDKIEVYMGQLKGVVATVRKMLENGTMMVEPRLGDLGIGKIGHVVVDPRECCKYFEPGQRVKVISHHAKQRGRIGDVIKADTDAQTVIVAFASLGMDGWPEEVHLPINDVKVTFEQDKYSMQTNMTTNQDEVDKTTFAAGSAFTLYDLVHVEQGDGVSSQPAVVLQLFPNDGMKVLSTANTVLDVKQSECHLKSNAKSEKTISEAIKGEFGLKRGTQGRLVQADNDGRLLYELDAVQCRFMQNKQISGSGAQTNQSTQRIMHILTDGMYIRDDENKNDWMFVRGTDCKLEKAVKGGLRDFGPEAKKSQANQLALTTSKTEKYAIDEAAATRKDGGMVERQLATINQVAADMGTLALTHGSAVQKALTTQKQELAIIKEEEQRPDKIPLKWQELHDKEKGQKKAHPYKGLRMKIMKSTDKNPYKGQLCEFRQVIDEEHFRVALQIKSKLIIIPKIHLTILKEKNSKKQEESRLAIEKYDSVVIARWEQEHQSWKILENPKNPLNGNYVCLGKEAFEKKKQEIASAAAEQNELSGVKAIQDKSVQSSPEKKDDIAMQALQVAVLNNAVKDLSLIATVSDKEWKIVPVKDKQGKEQQVIQSSGGLVYKEPTFETDSKFAPFVHQKAEMHDTMKQFNDVTGYQKHQFTNYEFTKTGGLTEHEKLIADMAWDPNFGAEEEEEVEKKAATSSNWEGWDKKNKDDDKSKWDSGSWNYNDWNNNKDWNKSKDDNNWGSSGTGYNDRDNYNKDYSYNNNSSGAAAASSSGYNNNYGATDNWNKDGNWKWDDATNKWVETGAAAGSSAQTGGNEWWNQGGSSAANNAEKIVEEEIIEEEVIEEEVVEKKEIMEVDMDDL